VAPGEDFARAQSQLDLRMRNACLLAGSFADAGFDVVVDDVLIAFRLDDYERLLRPRPLHYVLLLPDRDAVRERNRGRADKDVFEAWQFLDAEVRQTQRRGLWLDTSLMDAEATVKAVESRLEEASLS
jgi:chloramphenicol 3-O-phosphotransferase